MERTGRETWAKRVERWRSSELTAAEFAQEIGVSASSLKWWSWKLGSLARATSTDAKVPAKPRARRERKRRAKRSRKAAVSPLTFVEMSTTARSEPMEIVLVSGVRVRVAADFDAAALARLISVVEPRA
jgi:hypothetical protein